MSKVAIPVRLNRHLPRATVKENREENGTLTSIEVDSMETIASHRGQIRATIIAALLARALGKAAE